MADPQPRMIAFSNAIVSGLKTAMPKLRDCKAIDDWSAEGTLSERRIQAPAALVSLIRTNGKLTPNGQINLTVRVAVYFITEGREDKRKAACWAMAEGFLSLLPNNRFGLNRIGAPAKPAIDPLVSQQGKNSRRGVTILAVSWDQELRHIGDGLFDDELVLLTELYLNDDGEPHYVLEEGSAQ